MRCAIGLTCLRFRPERQKQVQRFWPLTMRYARYLANLPHVRMVGITGSLAAGNVKADCDIDFMVLTDAGAMWRTRALAMVLALIDREDRERKIVSEFFPVGRRALAGAAEPVRRA